MRFTLPPKEVGEKMRKELQQHRTKLQVAFVLIMVVLLVAVLLYPGYQQLHKAEGAANSDEGDDKAPGTLTSRFMAESGTFWQQLLASALPKPLVNAEPKPGLDSWATIVAQILFKMRVSTPAAFLALGIPVLRIVIEPDEEEVMLSASDPLVPPLVSVVEPPSQEAQALGWTATPQMLIYHTHNIESFVPTSGKAHIYDDQNQTIVHVGARLAEELNKAEVEVTHSKADNSSKDYTKAYSESLKNITQILKQKPSIEYAFDIHRDAGPRTTTTTVIEGQSTARIYIVVGTNTTFGHPNYQKNVAFAQQLNDKLNKLYPGLSRGVRITSRSRYNQHVRDKALLIEVGGDQSTMDEALRAVTFLSKAIVAVAKDLQSKETP